MSLSVGKTEDLGFTRRVLLTSIPRFASCRISSKGNSLGSVNFLQLCNAPHPHIASLHCPNFRCEWLNSPVRPLSASQDTVCPPVMGSNVGHLPGNF
ncbi:hypothetical protein AVEN_196924-1 [Araneus ventricosus]|uniref:Uncharacterized protein n=1 Tax=Araneus ventricosus TaxID=182803 RepID=A0A4Y2LP17_ARAVE|nr:hypothetical protein AVEN_196924-1 [Araneus ventricosus]